MASAVVEGLDSFTSDDGDVDTQAEAFARQVGQFGEHFGFYVNKITIPEKVDLDPVDEDAFTTEVDRRWLSDVTSRNLKRRVIMISLLLRPSISDKLGPVEVLLAQERERAVSRRTHRAQRQAQ